jgi:predicted dehydrogenase
MLGLMSSQSSTGHTGKAEQTAGALNAAIAGAGLMGYWHAQAVARAGGRVLAVIDRDPAAAQRLAARLPQARPYPSLEAAATEHALDVLHVCTPTATHVALARAGLEHGLHVLVEKPLAPTARETGQLLELAAARGLALCPVHQFVFQAGVQAAQRRQHALGRPVRLQVEIRSAGGAGLDDAAQNQLAADILPHCLALAEHLLPGSIQAAAWRTLQPRAGELCVLGRAGATAILFDLSLHGRPPINRCTLVGERGALLLNLFHGYAVYERGAVSKLHKVMQPLAASAQELGTAAANLAGRTLHRQPAYPGLWELIRQFYSAVAQQAAPPLAPAAVLAVACARDAILERVDAERGEELGL